MLPRPELAARALTHLSAPARAAQGRAQSYQRLEFLGDRVLGRRRRADALRGLSAGERGRTVDAARQAGAPRDLRRSRRGMGRRPACRDGPGRSARAAAARRRRSSPTSAKSLIGAVFLDARLRGGARRRDRARLARPHASPTPSPSATPRPRCRNGRRRARCRRRAMSKSTRSGPAHAPHFVMQVVLDGYEPEQGEATSKRAAEQAAAQAFSRPLERRHERDPLRLRRADRRAERRQIDAASTRWSARKCRSSRARRRRRARPCAAS